MKVAVVGKGGREHALAKKLQASPLVSSIWVFPGNPGMKISGLDCIQIENPDEILSFCQSHKIELVVLGPEAAILSNLKNLLEANGIACFAPAQAVAKLESSKLFCKQILTEAQVPTAQYEVCYKYSEAQRKLRQHNFVNPIVLKADGLAAGKGVWVCDSLDMAERGLQTLGDQLGYPILLEQCLQGQELSAFALCDGRDFVFLGTACDYKRINPDIFSANTGGMGAYSPCDFISEQEILTIQEYFKRTLHCLDQKELTYHGFLFMGLMKTSSGLYVLEYNVRMGDPETQALMPRLKSDLAFLIKSATDHKLKEQKCFLSPDASVHVVATSEGYPSSQMVLNQTVNLPLQPLSGAEIYFSGVGLKENVLVNTGGRVLGVTALADNRSSARQLAYRALEQISFQGMYYRKDIAE